MLTTPFHARTAPLCATFLWRSWNGRAAVRAYDEAGDREYHALRHGVGVVDVSPLRRIDLRGPDAARLLSRAHTRDLESLRQGRATWGALLDEQGRCADDGIVYRLGPDLFRLSTEGAHLPWLESLAQGLRVELTDTTDAIGALAVAGPRAREALASLVDVDLDTMRWFSVRSARIAGRPGWISRTGRSGDLGYELWINADDALAVWDALADAGRPHDLVPVGVDALDVARVEAGIALRGVDWVAAREAAPGSARTPDGCGLGGTVVLQRATRFVGQDAVERERAGKGVATRLVGVEVSGAALEALHEEYGVPLERRPRVESALVPILAADGRASVGHLSSLTWSPVLGRFVGLGWVRSDIAAEGARIRIERVMGVDRRHLPATTAPRPVHDPDRKRALGRATS